MSAIYTLKIFEGVYTYVKSMNIFFYLEKSDENMTLAAVQWRADRMDHESFSSTFLRIYCSLNIVVHYVVVLHFPWYELI